MYQGEAVMCKQCSSSWYDTTKKKPDLFGIHHSIRWRRPSTVAAVFQNTTTVGRAGRSTEILNCASDVPGDPQSRFQVSSILLCKRRNGMPDVGKCLRDIAVCAKVPSWRPVISGKVRKMKSGVDGIMRLISDTERCLTDQIVIYTGRCVFKFVTQGRLTLWKKVEPFIANLVVFEWLWRAKPIYGWCLSLYCHVERSGQTLIERVWPCQHKKQYDLTTKISRLHFSINRLAS